MPGPPYRTVEPRGSRTDRTVFQGLTWEGRRVPMGAMPTAADLFGVDKALVGMVHLEALPGAPRHELELARIVDRAVEEAVLLRDAGFDAVMIENMHDVPYLQRQVGPEVVSAMTMELGKTTLSSLVKITPAFRRVFA